MNVLIGLAYLLGVSIVVTATGRYLLIDRRKLLEE